MKLVLKLSVTVALVLAAAVPSQAVSRPYIAGIGDLTSVNCAGATAPALPALGGAAPTLGATTNAQLAAAESRKAARNTANGLLGGIMLLLGSMVWAVGMAVFGKK